jgi:hypothetical protein
MMVCLIMAAVEGGIGAVVRLRRPRRQPSDGRRATVTMRSDGGGATDRRRRPAWYNSIQWYLHPHSLPFRAVAFQRPSRCIGSSRLLYSTHSLETTLLLRVQRSATGRITTCPPHDYRALPSVTRKEQSRSGDEQR